MLADFPCAGPDLDRADFVVKADRVQIVDIAVDTVAAAVIAAMLKEDDISTA